MLKKIGVENIIKGKIATGIEIIFLPDGAFEINSISLKKNKSQFIIEKQLSGIPDIGGLANEINKKSPIILVINGKGIIHRKVSFVESDSPSILLNKVLPNANINDFYIQQEIIDDTSKFISVIRKNSVDEIIETLKNNQLTGIVEISLGPFIINELLPLIDKKIINKELLSFKNYQLQIREDKISEITYADSNTNGEPIVVADEKIQQGSLIAYAAALSYFIERDNGITNSEILESLKSEYRQKQKFDFFTWTILIATFIILVVNYFVFNNYWTKNNEINSRLVINQSALKKYESLKLEYSQKKEFLEENGLLENSLTSYYADQLAASVPASIQWTSVDIHPLKKKDLNDVSETLSFENKIIKVSGKCDRNTELNDWMKIIKKKPWISDVVLLNYVQDNAADEGLFSIEIKLK